MTIGGLNSVFNRALDGLQVSQQGLSVVSNNIANVNTEGYNKQTYLQGTRAIFGNGALGGGVVGIGITSLIDPFVERQLANETSEFGFAEGRRLTLSSLESLLSEADGNGLGSSITSFFNSWSELAADPSNGALRQNVSERGVDIATKFNSLHSQISNLRVNVSDSIEANLSKVNSYLATIDSFNESIKNSDDDAARGEIQAQTQLTLRNLSKEMDINYFQNADGTVTVQAKGSGSPLVSSAGASTLSLSDDLSSGGIASINLTLPGGNTTIDITNRITQGALGGYLADRNTVLNEQLANLNELAYEFATQFNTAHRAGYGLDGNDNRNFFGALASSANAASLITVDNDILNDTDAIAAAGSDPTSVSGPGDNEVALQIVDLQNSLAMDGNSKTFNQFYSNMVGSVGVTAGAVNRNYELKSSTVDRLSLQRESISGVNIDEEAADLMRYQRAFEGASRVMQVAQEMVDTLLQL